MKTHSISALGTDVTLVEMLPRLVSTEEPEIRHILEDNFRKVCLNKKAVKVNSNGDQKEVILEDLKKGKRTEVQ